MKIFENVSEVLENKFLANTIRTMKKHPKVDFSDAYSKGQLQSKKWLVDELKKVNKIQVPLGTIYICAGWYGVLANMLLESGINFEKIRSFDIDPTSIAVSETLNKPWVIDDWKFKATKLDIMDVQYEVFSYKTKRHDGSQCEMVEYPRTIINTSCEHIEDLKIWYDKIPYGRLVVLQNNNFFDCPEHVNCVKSIQEFKYSIGYRDGPLSLFEGTLDLGPYKRFMLIGLR